MTLHELSVSPLPATLTTLPRPDEAYAQVLPLLDRMTDDQLVAVNVDIPTVVARILAKVDVLQTLIPQASQRVVGFDPALFTQLESRAVAALQAHTLHLTAVTPQGDDLPALLETGMELRLRLFHDAQYLSQRGFLDPGRLDPVRCLNGYKNVATDLMALVNLFQTSWSEVAGKCAVREADLSLATEIAQRILKGVAVREHNQDASVVSAVIRQRAYSLLFHTYDEIRSVVNLLRWKQGDADDFAPSLFAGRRYSRRDRDAAGEAGAGKGPEAPDTAGTAGAAGGAKPAGGGQAPGKPAVPAGQPGGSPFIG